MVAEALAYLSFVGVVCSAPRSLSKHSDSVVAHCDRTEGGLGPASGWRLATCGRPGLSASETRGGQTMHIARLAIRALHQLVMKKLLDVILFNEIFSFN